MSVPSDTTGAADDVTFTVSRRDLILIRSALEEFLASFSHEQGDVVDRIKALLARLPDGAGPGERKEISSFRRLTL